MMESKVDKLSRLASHLQLLTSEAKGATRIMAAYPFKTMAEQNLEETAQSLRQTADELEALVAGVKHERARSAA